MARGARRRLTRGMPCACGTPLVKPKVYVRKSTRVLFGTPYAGRAVQLAFSPLAAEVQAQVTVVGPLRVHIRECVVRRRNGGKHLVGVGLFAFVWMPLDGQFSKRLFDVAFCWCQLGQPQHVIMVNHSTGHALSSSSSSSSSPSYAATLTHLHRYQRETVVPEENRRPRSRTTNPARKPTLAPEKSTARESPVAVAGKIMREKHDSSPRTYGATDSPHVSWRIATCFVPRAQTEHHDTTSSTLSAMGVNAVCVTTQAPNSPRTRCTGTQHDHCLPGSSLTRTDRFVVPRKTPYLIHRLSMLSIVRGR